MNEADRVTHVPIEIARTEEGQRVAWDGWAWQRRELTKVHPLDEDWPSEDRIAAVLAQHGLADLDAAAPIQVPARICSDVYLAGSWPNHTYAVDCGPEGLAIIDPGLSANYDSLMDNIRALGLVDRQVRWVLNTHAHFDHSMADGLFRNAGAEVCVGSADADAVEQGSAGTANYMWPEIVADYPTTTVDRRLDDGDALLLGNKQLQVIATPGHTPGSVCFAMSCDGQQLLFSGDTVLHDYRLGWQDSPYADNNAYLRSLERLALTARGLPAGSGWDILLPGHGTLALENAHMDVEKAREAVARHLRSGSAIPALPFDDPSYRRRMFRRESSARTAVDGSS